MKTMNKVLIMACVAGGAATVATAQNSLTTLFAGGNSGSAGGAVYFDVTVGPAPITITGYDVNTLAVAASSFGFQVYTKVGTYVGSEANIGAWTSQATGSGVAAGSTFPSPVTLGNTFVLNANTTYGMALVLGPTGGPVAQHSYTNGTGPNQNYSNADLSLSLGAALNVPFAGTPFTPRVWNGTIKYNVGGTTGACCRTDGSCVITSSAACASINGIYRGDNSVCATANCPQPATGACCRFDGTCSVLTSAQCTSSGGVYRGDGTACATANCPVPPPVVYTNCGLTTGPNTLSGVPAPANSLWSECARDENDPTTANTVAGFSSSGAFRLADDFVVPAGGMNVAYIRVYAYTTGATVPGITGATLQILDGSPTGTPNVVFGDQTTNRLAASGFTDIYRTFNTVTPPTCGGVPTAPGTTRRLQEALITVNQFLPAGTYWLDFNVTGASFTPPATRSTAIGRQCDPNNSNGLQFNAAWLSADDLGQGCVPVAVQQDFPFQILGTTGSSCYANCDGSSIPPILNVSDFICFQTKYAAGDPYANCDGSTVPPVLNVSDFICYQTKYAAGCS